MQSPPPSRRTLSRNTGLIRACCPAEPVHQLPYAPAAGPRAPRPGTAGHQRRQHRKVRRDLPAPPVTPASNPGQQPRLPASAARGPACCHVVINLHRRPQAVDNCSAARSRRDVARLADRPSARVDRARRTCLAVMPRLLAYCLDDGLSLALANLKPGTGKTTSAVWLAHVFARAGNSVLLVDADPSGSALEWSDLAAMDPRLAAPQAAFPFRIVALPSRELHRRLPDIARDDDVVIIDAPQIEDHAAIAAPRCGTPMSRDPVRAGPDRRPPRRCGTRSPTCGVRDRPSARPCCSTAASPGRHSTSDARPALQDLGYDVLARTGPRLRCTPSFGLPIPDTAATCGAMVHDLIVRSHRHRPGPVVKPSPASSSDLPKPVRRAGRYAPHGSAVSRCGGGCGATTGSSRCCWRRCARFMFALCRQPAACVQRPRGRNLGMLPSTASCSRP